MLNPYAIYSIFSGLNLNTRTFCPVNFWLKKLSKDSQTIRSSIKTDRFLFKERNPISQPGVTPIY